MTEPFFLTLWIVLGAVTHCPLTYALISYAVRYIFLNSCRVHEILQKQLTLQVNFTISYQKTSFYINQFSDGLKSACDGVQSLAAVNDQTVRESN